MKMTSSVGVVLSLVTLFAMVSCGGGSGGSTASTTSGGGSRPPVASEPSCSASVTAKRTVASLIPKAQTNVWMPPTSVAKLADAGIKFHTNHVLLEAGQVRSVAGHSPSQIATAYNVREPAGQDAIAIVDAYNYPTALADFNVFSRNFGLPVEQNSVATASSNGVFQVVYAAGFQPANNGGWSQESSIDIEWAHAMAPNAKIYLVEANSDSASDVVYAVSVAKSLPGVQEVSTSFGTIESACAYAQYDGTFLQPGVTFFAASGDNPGDLEFPALSMNVIAVGATTLSTGSNGAWQAENVWGSSGCGRSAYEPRPLCQDGVYGIVGPYRGGVDLCADGNPNTGVAVYDSYSYGGYSGWLVAGGTSVSCPIIAGIVNNSGYQYSSSQALLNVLYANRGSGHFNRVGGGSSGYNSLSPYGLPNGLGSPNAIRSIF